MKGQAYSGIPNPNFYPKQANPPLKPITEPAYSNQFSKKYFNNSTETSA
jgi:hypothetical protein